MHSVLNTKKVRNKDEIVGFSATTLRLVIFDDSSLHWVKYKKLQRIVKQMLTCEAAGQKSFPSLPSK